MLRLVGFVPFSMFQILDTEYICPLQAEKYLLKKKKNMRQHKILRKMAYGTA